MNFTVLGAGGFIGNHLVEHLQSSGHSVVGLTRADMSEPDNPLPQHDLGHLIDAIGITADFRQRPFDTVQAHVGLLRAWLEHARFDSFTYLSSTRVYAGSDSTHEDQPLAVRPADPDQLYNLSKLMGESLCLSSGRPARVVRLSNVYGPDFRSGNFLTQVLRDAAREHRVVLRSAPASAKDYVALQDVVAWLPQIAARGQHRIYNLASGANLSNAALAAGLREQGVEVAFAPDAPTWSFPPIHTARVDTEFNAARHSLTQDLPGLLAAFRTHFNNRPAATGAGSKDTP